MFSRHEKGSNCKFRSSVYDWHSQPWLKPIQIKTTISLKCQQKPTINSNEFDRFQIVTFSKGISIRLLCNKFWWIISLIKSQLRTLSPTLLWHNVTTNEQANDSPNKLCPAKYAKTDISARILWAKVLTVRKYGLNNVCLLNKLLARLNDICSDKSYLCAKLIWKTSRLFLVGTSKIKKSSTQPLSGEPFFFLEQWQGSKF